MSQPKQVAISSTSLHTLSADRRLSKGQRISWLAYNLLNNAFPRTYVDRGIKELKFCLTEQRLDELWDSIADGVSPSRRLSDLFWMSLPWADLSKELGRISILEIGCGTGVYGRLLQKILGDCFEKYLGVDIEASPQWASNMNDPRLAFEVGRAGDVYKFLADANLIMTQSALEHFEEDLLYFRQISDHVMTSKAPLLQVHLIPSSSCIATFPWHGIREYTPRTISKMARLFGSETKIYLYSLGGPKCNRVHRKFITWPNLRRAADLRHAESGRYRQNVRSAILADFNDSSDSSAFYALVLASNFQCDFFTTESG